MTEELLAKHRQLWKDACNTRDELELQYYTADLGDKTAIYNRFNQANELAKTLLRTYLEARVTLSEQNHGLPITSPGIKNIYARPR